MCELEFAEKYIKGDNLVELVKANYEISEKLIAEHFENLKKESLEAQDESDATS